MFLNSAISLILSVLCIIPINPTSLSEIDEYIESSLRDSQSLAIVATSLALTDLDEALQLRRTRENRTSELFFEAHQKIFPGDGHILACCRAVSVSVLMTGIDPDFPRGGVKTQRSHMRRSDKWQEFRINDVSELQPGDIFVNRGGTHVVLYVGNEIVNQVHPDLYYRKYNIVHGQLRINGAALDKMENYSSSYIRGGTVFRLTTQTLTSFDGNLIVPDDMQDLIGITKRDFLEYYGTEAEWYLLKYGFEREHICDESEITINGFIPFNLFDDVLAKYT